MFNIFHHWYEMGNNHTCSTAGTMKQLMPAKLKKVMALTFRVAHIRYLQEKHCPLLVQGQFNPEVVRLYRTLQKNTPGLAPKYLDLLEKATTISTANVRSQNV